MVLKAELHCHLEGSASADLVLRQADKYGADVSKYIRDGAFVWHDFTSFLAAYDAAASLFRNEEDFALMIEEYLTSIARMGAIYSEVFTSPDHAEQSGLSAQAYTDAIGEGMERAQAKTGIEARMIVTGVRHTGVESVERAARFAARCEHRLVTGFGMGGEERFGEIEDYARAFEIAREAGLGITVHAGELAGWQSVAEALDHIRPARIGHGVRAIENPDLVRRIADEGIVLECCPGSNIALQVFADYAAHPVPAFLEAGCRVTISSDDPPYFHTSLQREYDIAAEHFGMDDAALVQLTRTSLESAFVDDGTRKALMSRLDDDGPKY